MLINSRNIPISINNNPFLISDLSLNQSVGLVSPFKNDDVISEKVLPESMYIGNLNLKYYLTGQDYLKSYIYSKNSDGLSLNIGGLLANQCYVKSYNIACSPNSPVEVSSEISIFDKVSGAFISSPPIISTGTILRMSDCIISNLSNYTESPIDNILQANFSYSADLEPSYKAIGTGQIPTRADNVFINERTISTDITSDSTNFDLTLSGQRFGLNLYFVNPYNSGIQESFGCSGFISEKSINISSPGTHTHNLRVEQKHLNNVGGISGIVLNGNTSFNIVSHNGTHPFTSNNGNLNYVNKIILGDTFCTGYTITRNLDYDSIIVPIPLNAPNSGIITVYGTKGTFINSNPLSINFSQLRITGLSRYSGAAGTNIYITGSGFHRITDVSFGNIKSEYQVLSNKGIKAIVPYGTLTSNIIVNSQRGQSSQTGLFFGQPDITTITPTTGQWKDTIIIGGTNFSGITGVKFNGINAFSFSVLNNSLITCRSPETGRGYTQGYITIYGSGGSDQSISQYNPILPIYNFTPSSGTPNLNSITIYTKIDSGYMFPSGDGYKVRIGNVDTKFKISGVNYTGALTGLVPIGGIDDYIYIYRPDGVSTYPTHSSKFNVIGEPLINTVKPISANQFSYFNTTIIGENMKYFTNKPWYLMFSGGVNNDTQTFSNVVSNSGDFANTAIFNKCIITGATGLYNVIVQNVAGQAVHNHLFSVNTGINKSQLFKVDDNASSVFRGSPLNLVDFSYDTYHAFSLENDNTEKYVTLTAKSNKTVDFSLLKILMYNLPSSATKTPNPSGIVRMYYKNQSDNNPFFTSVYTNLSGATISNTNFTGVYRIRIVGVTGVSNKYMGISELEIF